MALKDRLMGRERPTATYWLQVSDSSEAEAAHTAARTALQLRTMIGDEQGIQEAGETLAAAQAALKACFEPIVCTALPPAEFEALVDAHKPREDTDDDAWNMDTFPRACFLACAPPEMSVSEWEQFLDASVGSGERTKLYNTAINANVRVPDPTVPKDWTETLA